MTLNVLWLQSGGCGGCSMSLLCADTPHFPELLRNNGVQLLWHPALSLHGEHDLLDLHPIDQHWRRQRVEVEQGAHAILAGTG